MSMSVEVVVHAEHPKPISRDLFGIFFEDLNYTADGGLYAELIQNRSFAYSSADHPNWNCLTAWELLRQQGACSVALHSAAPIHPNNPHYIVLRNDATDGVLGLRNTGFDGIALQAGEDYDVALFACVLDGRFAPVRVRLEGRTRALLGEAELFAPTSAWAKYTTTIRCNATDPHGRCVVEVAGAGSLALDVISLFPRKTFRGHPNGLRVDPAQKPVPVVSAGCCCPNTSALWSGLWEQGQCGLPADAIPADTQTIRGRSKAPSSRWSRFDEPSSDAARRQCQGRMYAELQSYPRSVFTPVRT